MQVISLHGGARTHVCLLVCCLSNDDRNVCTSSTPTKHCFSINYACAYMYTSMYICEFVLCTVDTCHTLSTPPSVQLPS